MLYVLVLVDGSGEKSGGEYRSEEAARESGERSRKQHSGVPVYIEVHEDDGTFVRIINLRD